MIPSAKLWSYKDQYMPRESKEVQAYYEDAWYEWPHEHIELLTGTFFLH